MGKLNYLFSSFLGLIPSFFIFNTIGSGLNEFIKYEESFSFIAFIMSKQIYLPISFFVILMILAGLIRKKIFNLK